MILLHTADWHIGQYFFGYDRKNEHIFFFNWLKDLIRGQKADVLLVSGDIFDSPNPSAESQKMYYRFLREITSENPGLQIVITAGNHDSSARLEAPNPLLEEMNVYVKGMIKRNDEKEIDYTSLFVPLKKDDVIKAWCIAVPYLRQGDYPASDNYSKGISAMYKQLYEELEKINNSSLPVIVMGHLQATGSEISETDRSERTIIGGLECVTPETFDREEVLYTALGHLHKAQRVSGRENVRYAGSPLPMSFAEKNYHQGINLIEIEDRQLTRIERISFDPPVKLLSLPGEPKPLAYVLDEIRKLPYGKVDNDSPYLELKILITEPEPSMKYQIENALENKSVRLARLASFTRKQEKNNKIITYEELKTIDPLEIAEDVFLNRYGNEMPESMKNLLQKVIQETKL